MISQSQNNFLEGRVAVTVGDITRETVDAIVNAANSSLVGGAGVDGAIHRVGGPAIIEACREIRRRDYPHGLQTGEAVITTAGQLPAQHVIHTVGPIYGRHAGREAQLLAACYQNSLALATRHQLSSIAFPAISTGAYGYPLEEAAAISSSAIKKFVEQDLLLEQIRLVFFTSADAEIFLRHHKFV
ncbi:MAG TPA: O-acetyl-ADP-ribose deacetylase [Pyrinomonadaceae bacterium]|nr:O-acetyl-ADP-ribose deacetylase [Pyrinomonadaceae bacterium]